MTAAVRPGPLGTHFPGVFDFTTLRGPHDENNPYSGLSMCVYTGDTTSHCNSCREAIAAEIDITPTSIIQPRQVHGSKIVLIDDNFMRLDPESRLAAIDETDGTITAINRIAIGINTADCVPVLLCSTGGTRLVAAVHAGWRGTLAGIAAKAVGAMKEAGGTGIAAYIGVSICRNCFEVGDEVAEAFAAAGMDDGIIFRSAATGKAHIDLQAANRLQLTRCGLPAEMIFTDGTCSKHDTSGNYFSARRMGVNSGRTFTGIMLI